VPVAAGVDVDDVELIRIEGVHRATIHVQSDAPGLPGPDVDGRIGRDRKGLTHLLPDPTFAGE
jgi:hypothetical protein